jgi:hypothetical protein
MLLGENNYEFRDFFVEMMRRMSYKIHQYFPGNAANVNQTTKYSINQTVENPVNQNKVV